MSRTAIAALMSPLPVLVSAHLPFEATHPDTGEKYDCHAVRMLLEGRETLVVSAKVAGELRKQLVQP